MSGDDQTVCFVCFNDVLVGREWTRSTGGGGVICLKCNRPSNGGIELSFSQVTKDWFDRLVFMLEATPKMDVVHWYPRGTSFEK